MIGATIFILLGLVLLVDFAHSWSETCLEKWENSPSSNFWQWVLIGSTGLMYAFTITLTGLLYGYFAGAGCTLNRFFITFNLIFCVAITVMCVHPLVQEFNPRSGLAQSAMVAVYCTYLVVSAITNHTQKSIKSCNPLRDGAGEGTRKAVVLIGGVFTFLAIAYSTTRAATQSRALVGQKKPSGHIQLSEENPSEMDFVTTQPGRTKTPRYQAMLAAVEAGWVIYDFYSILQALPSLQVPFRNLLCMRNRHMEAMKTTKSKAKNATMRRPVLVTTCVFFCNLPQCITHLRLVLVVPCHICWRYDVCCYASHGLVCSIEIHSSIDLTIFYIR